MIKIYETTSKGALYCFRNSKTDFNELFLLRTLPNSQIAESTKHSCLCIDIAEDKMNPEILSIRNTCMIIMMMIMTMMTIITQGQ